MDLIIQDEAKFNHAVKVATTLAKSSIVPQNFRGKPEDVFAALVLGSELGLSPMQSLNALVIIQGQTTLKAQTMLAIARAKLPAMQLDIKSDAHSVTVTGKRDANDLGYTTTWDDAKAASFGLLGKDNYKKQKITMFRWRAISEVLRVIAPDVLLGLYAAEEMEDVPEKNLQQVLNESIEQDFPIPPEEKIVGPLYRVQNGKFRGDQFKDLDLIELESYADDIDARKTKKTWETQLSADIRSYIANYSLYREQLLDLEAESQAD